MLQPTVPEGMRTSHKHPPHADHNANESRAVQHFAFPSAPVPSSPHQTLVTIANRRVCTSGKWLQAFASSPPRADCGRRQRNIPQNTPARSGSWAVPGLSPRRLQEVPGRMWPNPEQGAGCLRSPFYCRLHLHWKENNLSFLLYYCYNLRVFPGRNLQFPAEHYHHQNYQVKCNH